MNALRFLALALTLLVCAYLPVPPGASAQGVAQVYAVRDAGACAPGPNCTAELYALGNGGSSPDRDLGVIRTADGAAPAIHALALSPDDHLYGADAATLYTVESTCAGAVCTATPVGHLTGLDPEPLTGLTFHPDGRLFGVTRNGRLLSINRKTVASTVVHDFGATGPAGFTAPYTNGFGFEGGLAFGADGALYASVFPCPHCVYIRDPGPIHDGLARLLPPQFTSASLLSADIGFEAMRGLVFLTGDTAGSKPRLIGTTGVQRSETPCKANGAMVDLSIGGGAGHVSRCLPFATWGATASPILPPLIASVTLKPTISPGATQIVSVVASPDTVTRLTVTFPNGTTIAKKDITDTTGRVHFRFVQPSSAISRSSRTAVARIQVGSGQSENERQLKYQIRYAAIDAVVWPRDPLPGHHIDVYVHSWPSHRVRIDIAFPTGTLKRSLARTGAGGWTHSRWTVPRGRIPTRSRQGAVLAFVYGVSARYSTVTTFDVQIPAKSR